MNNEMISLQKVWEAAGGDEDVMATKEQTMLVLKQLDECLDTQEGGFDNLKKKIIF